jgi:hypothetical protein
MTFLEELTAHKSGLLLLKSELWWYGVRGWDGIPERVCLLLDAAIERTYTTYARASARAEGARRPPTPAATRALLLIDGRPHWVWVGADDVELL